jgi:hypothetical protein
MQVRFDTDAYHQRAQVETVMSMIKRNQLPYVRGHSYQSQCRDLRLMALTHNVVILICIEVFYRAILTPFLSQSVFVAGPIMAKTRAMLRRS